MIAVALRHGNYPTLWASAPKAPRAGLKWFGMALECVIPELIVI